MIRHKRTPEEVKALETRVKDALYKEASKDAFKAICQKITESKTAWANYCKTQKKPETVRLRQQLQNDFIRQNIAELLKKSRKAEGEALVDCVTTIAGFACQWTGSLHAEDLDRICKPD